MDYLSEKGYSLENLDNLPKLCTEEKILIMNHEVSTEDFDCLSDEKWLNDKVIMYCFLILCD